MRALYLDCSNGVHSNMIVGALCDLGLKPSALEWEFSAIELGDFHMHFDRRERDGSQGIVFTLHAGSDHTHCDSHSHNHEPGKTLAAIHPLLAKSDLSPFVKEKALAIYQALASAEAIIQETPPEDAALYEAGTLEGIATVVAACVGLEALQIGKVYASPLREGQGWMQDAKGPSTIPSPVTLAVLGKIPLSLSSEPFQLLPPLSAAILSVLVDEFGPRPELQNASMGYGITARRFPVHPSVLRAELGDLPA